ncbi:hypothetical protein EVAR_72180_1, partial [Eumeta japonica]
MQQHVTTLPTIIRIIILLQYSTSLNHSQSHHRFEIAAVNSAVPNNCLNAATSQASTGGITASSLVVPAPSTPELYSNLSQQASTSAAAAMSMPTDSDTGYVYDLYIPDNEQQADNVDLMDDNYL